MWTGSVEAIFIADKEGEPTRSVEAVRAIPGRGLEGDRYHVVSGKDPDRFEPKRELTLIELEAIEAFRQESSVEFGLGDSRRNIVTRDVPLNHLVGREFRIGEVRARGLQLCEPCSHLAGLTTTKALKGLLHRGGLRAQIVIAGTIRVGDEIREA